ncbi:MAG: hypothetical protein WCI00_05815 [bacterium]
MATIFIRSEIPVTPNKEAKVQEDLSSTIPTHVPITSKLQYKIGTWE